MAWKVRRAAGPGVHYLGSTSLTFDDDGACVTDDAEAVAIARSFPRMFLVEDTDETPPPKEPSTDEEGESPDPDAAEGTGAAVPTADPVLDPSASTGAASVDPGTSGAYTAAELEALTVTDLRDLASTAQIPGASRMTKAELVAALLAAQGG
jgi:Rho termination factor, N-terminal domain